MEKLNEVKKVETKEEKVDVTENMIRVVTKKNRPFVKSIISDGKIYIVNLTKGNTAFLENSRKARTQGEINWIANEARICAEKPKTLEDYVKEFKANNIDFDGKTIPEYINTTKSTKETK